MKYKIDLHTHTNISDRTDYHGLNRPEIKLGTGKNNNLFIPYSVYEKIICLSGEK